MRVITGSARGRRLETLEGEDVRPTTDRIKEAVFSIIQFQTEGRVFLDLFAGSGQMGIEALSRGAKQALFVDNSKKSAETVRRNLKTTRLDENAKVFRTDYRSFLSVNAVAVDIAFLDPPYGSGLLQKALPDLANRMAAGGVIVCESPVGEELPDPIGAYRIYRTYRYGKTQITVYRDTDI